MPQPQQCQIRAVSVTYTTAHSSAGSLTHLVRPGIKSMFLWLLVRFISSVPQWELPGVFDFAKAFSASIEMIMWFLTFLLLMWCMTLIDLCMLNHPYELSMNPTWLWCMIFLMCCWIQLAKILFRIFASIFIRYWPIIFFFGNIFGFVISVTVAS